MTMQQRSAGNISENSRRIARNTLLLYFRMLLMMFIGLFTSRVVLKTLGVENYGIYGAVGGVVTLFTFITASISSAVSRYMSFELGKGDSDKLRRVFSTSIVIQLILAAVIILLTETAGLWFLNHKMVIPEGRLGAAHFVLQCSLGVVVINLLAVPFNAAIISHEKMSAFALISIIEATLKLAVALVLYLSVGDKLICYALLMLAVALFVRFSYGAYCRKYFPESRGKLVYDKEMVKEMGRFAGWSFFGSSAYVFNTQGVNLVINLFFGVTLNAARLVATQVEGIVKQFVSNFLTALNPQITKSWASGDKEYCFELTRKGAKFTWLVILFFFVPFYLEAPLLLKLWLGNYPTFAEDFARLTLIALLVDLFGNSLLTLVQATGRVKSYYLITGLTSYLCLPLVWLVFKCGVTRPHWAYIIFIIVYLAVLCEKLIITHSLTGFPIRKFLLRIFLPLLLLSSVSLALTAGIRSLIGIVWLRVVVTCLVAWASIALGTYFLILTEGEKAFLFRKASRFLPDRLYLKGKYRFLTGRRLNLSHPLRYNEKLQWLKLHDRKPIYHILVDKAEVKKVVEERIGKEYVVPTLGVWNSTEEICWEALPEQFVIKCTHDSGSTIICHNKESFDRETATQKLNAAMKVNFYRRDREWAYKGVRPRIIAEAMLGTDIRDYKFFCFDGVPRFMFMASDRQSSVEETKFDFFDINGKHLDWRNGHPCACPIPEIPDGFEQMKELAAKLSAGFPHVRIDFYQVNGQIYFGEYTFYHNGGFVLFEPDSADIELGKYLDINAVDKHINTKHS